MFNFEFSSCREICQSIQLNCFLMLFFPMGWYTLFEKCFLMSMFNNNKDAFLNNDFFLSMFNVKTGCTYKFSISSWKQKSFVVEFQMASISLICNLQENFLNRQQNCFLQSFFLMGFYSIKTILNWTKNQRYQNCFKQTCKQWFFNQIFQSMIS